MSKLINFFKFWSYKGAMIFKNNASTIAHNVSIIDSIFRELAAPKQNEIVLTADQANKGGKRNAEVGDACVCLTASQ